MLPTMYALTWTWSLDPEWPVKDHTPAVRYRHEDGLYSFDLNAAKLYTRDEAQVACENETNRYDTAFPKTDRQPFGPNPIAVVPVQVDGTGKRRI